MFLFLSPIELACVVLMISLELGAGPAFAGIAVLLALLPIQVRQLLYLTRMLKRHLFGFVMRAALIRWNIVDAVSLPRTPCMCFPACSRCALHVSRSAFHPYGAICNPKIPVVTKVLDKHAHCWTSSVENLAWIPHRPTGLRDTMQAVLSRYIGRLRDATAERTDERVRLEGEAISGALAMKMLGWEQLLLDAIGYHSTPPLQYHQHLCHP